MLGDDHVFEDFISTALTREAQLTQLHICLRQSSSTKFNPNLPHIQILPCRSCRMLGQDCRKKDELYVAYIQLDSVIHVGWI